MRKIFGASVPGVFGSRAIFRVLAAGVVGGTEEGSGRAVKKPSTVEGPPSPRASFIAADRDYGAETVDGVAGSEFVDDLIRERE